MKLISEVIETSNLVVEDVSGKKNHFIEGTFAQWGIVNRNKRLYSREAMESAVNRYNTDYIDKKRSLGEMNHPQRLNVDYERATHLITELKVMEDGVVYGKARILDKTPMGAIIVGLLDGGAAIGVSTRGGASLTESGKGYSIVGKDYLMTAVDVVSDPSAHAAWVDGIMESKEWVYIDGQGWIEEACAGAKKKLSKMSTKKIAEEQAKMFQDFMDLISAKN